MTSEQEMHAAPLLSLRGIVKRFGSFTANDDISLDISAGEAHGLIGENGAGKSTLVKIIYGLLEPTAGVIAFRGQPVRLRSPQDARALGAGMVFQHFSLFDNLTVAENIALVLPRGTPLSGLRERIHAVAARYNMPLEPDREVWTLSAGERQRIEIARCLLQDPKLIILDEPTSVLTPQEATGLFETLERLKAEGRALLYISHKLEEVRRLCDRATILRLGRKVGSCDPRQESARALAALMVGSAINEIRVPAARELGPERLSIHGLAAPSQEIHGVDLKALSLSVRGGEVVGIAGVAGNGQSEFFAVLSGETITPKAEAILLDGAPSGALGVNERRKLGAAFVPEERNGHGAAGDFTLTENLILSRHATGLTSRGLIDFDRARALAQNVIETFDVRKAGPDPAARTLSGGNLQKFVVGREILSEPGVLVINQPTWGVDAAAAATIRQALLDLAGRGAAVLLISQDLDELFEICDRVAVMREGRLSQAQETQGLTREDVGLLMAGAAPGDGAHAH